jgi:hypothetical protein
MAVERVISKNFPFDVVNSLDVIELDKLEVGYQVYVNETNKLYKYTTSGLEEISTFSSSDKEKLDNIVEIKWSILKDHECVDLGLPSGLLWATYNVGATKPEEYGSYYAWGETEEKENYNWSTYKWCNGNSKTLTKYCINSNYGTVDNKTVLDLEDDVAHVKWGSDWRMPTREEYKELCNNCTWTWTTLNGVNGYRVTGSNGNSLFLPAVGGNYGTEVEYSGLFGCYWSSSSYANND